MPSSVATYILLSFKVETPIAEVKPSEEKQEEKPIEIDLTVNIETPKVEAIPHVVVLEERVPAAKPQEQKVLTPEEELFRTTRERLMKIRETNFKLNSPNGILDLEKEPAYKRRNIQLENVPNEIFQLHDIYSLLDTSEGGNDCVTFDALGRPCNTDFATHTLIPQLIARADTVHLGSTSEFVFDENGNRVFLNSAVNPLLDDALLDVPNDTDEGATQRLAALGFTNEFRAVDLPRGVLILPPDVVPEPGTVWLLLAGFTGLTTLRRRVRYSS